MKTPSAETHARRLADAISRHRETHDQSLGELSRRTGLSKTSLMRLESGEANPSLETMWRIGEALGLTIAQLIEEPANAGGGPLAANAGGTVVSDTGMRGRLLGHDATAHRTEVFELDLSAGVHFESRAHDHGTRELVYCVSGQVRCGPLDAPMSLESGDSAEFDGGTAHFYAGVAGGGVAVLVMSYPARRSTAR